MKFVFACGGTAGHINPAIAIAGRLRELMPDCGILFIGAEGMMETELVPREGYELRTVKITNVSRELSLEGIRHNLETAKNVALSHHEAKKILREYRPDAVIGTGGYVCYPVLRSAYELHIPTALHESNAVPGLTTRMLAEHIDRMAVGFEECRTAYPHPDRVSVVGSPIRGAFDRYTRESARAELGLGEDERLVVSVWGSLGAGHMNGVLAEMIPMMERTDNIRLIHSAGREYYASLTEKLGGAETCAAHNAEVREYIYDMPLVMTAADLVLCRAGASTIAELCCLAKPAIIVPSPNVTNNHQEKNARVLERAGGAVVLLENEFDAAKLWSTVKTLLADRDRLRTMSEAMRSLAVPDSVERFCSLILGLCDAETGV